MKLIINRPEMQTSLAINNCSIIMLHEVSAFLIDSLLHELNEMSQNIDKQLCWINLG